MKNLIKVFRKLKDSKSGIGFSLGFIVKMVITLAICGLFFWFLISMVRNVA